MNCPRHPKVETALRCGKCGDLICPRCTVQTPVGARCPACAKLTRLPIFQIAMRDYLKATGVGLGLGIICGIVGMLLFPLAYFSFLAILLMGYLIGELVSRSVNRKRGLGLQIVAGISVLISYLIAMGISLNPYGLLALAGAIYIAVTRLR